MDTKYFDTKSGLFDHLVPVRSASVSQTKKKRIIILINCINFVFMLIYLQIIIKAFILG